MVGLVLAKAAASKGSVDWWARGMAAAALVAGLGWNAWTRWWDNRLHVTVKAISGPDEAGEFAFVIENKGRIRAERVVDARWAQAAPDWLGRLRNRWQMSLLAPLGLHEEAYDLAPKMRQVLRGPCPRGVEADEWWTVGVRLESGRWVCMNPRRGPTAPPDPQPGPAASSSP